MLMNKYIRTKEGFILFPETCQHCDIALGFISRSEIVSAGFVTVHRGRLICMGESVSLDIKSLPGDTDELHEWLGYES